MDSPAQARYLGMCLAGAKTYGPEFYDEFLATTHIDGRSLLEFPKLLGLGQNYVDNLDQTGVGHPNQHLAAAGNNVVAAHFRKPPG